jgi:hypothetical protein
MYELDPKGDIVLILRNPSTSFAVWNKDQNCSSVLHEGWELESNMSLLPQIEPRSSEGMPADDMLIQDSPRDQTSDSIQYISSSQSSSATTETVEPSNNLEDTVEVLASSKQFLVSSSHLRLASSYFKKALNENWKEGNKIDAEGRINFDILDCDPEALQIWLNVIHGRWLGIPRVISLEMLAKIAVLVDYYDCIESVGLISEVWVSHLEDPHEDIELREVTLWIFVSWKLRLLQQFKKSTSIAIKRSTKLLCDLGLPIPYRILGVFAQGIVLCKVLRQIIDAINQHRQESIGRAIEALHQLITDRCQEWVVCTIECDSMLIGALIKAMGRFHMFNPRPQKPFQGFSLTETVARIEGFQSPRWWSRRNQVHSCGLEPLLQPIIDQLHRSMEGLTLDQFSVQSK